MSKTELSIFLFKSSQTTTSGPDTISYSLQIETHFLQEDLCYLATGCDPVSGIPVDNAFEVRCYVGLNLNSNISPCGPNSYTIQHTPDLTGFQFGPTVQLIRVLLLHGTTLLASGLVYQSDAREDGGGTTLPSQNESDGNSRPTYFS